MVNKNTRSKILILLMFVLSITYVKADTTADVILKTSIPATVSIDKSSLSKETGTINPETGVHDGLRSVFTLQTNGSDDDFDFIIHSTLIVDDEVVPAYGNYGNSILFGNLNNPPTMTDVNNAKSLGNYNKNVISYPVTIVTESPMSSEWRNSYKDYLECFLIKLHGVKEGSVTHVVGGTPQSGTYSLNQDEAGTYQAVVTLTAIGK